MSDHEALLGDSKEDTCAWCGKILPEISVSVPEFVFMFGFFYCNEDCLREHVASK